MKLVRRLLFHVFATVAFLDLPVHNVQQHSYDFELTDWLSH